MSFFLKILRLMKTYYHLNFIWIADSSGMFHIYFVYFHRQISHIAEGDCSHYTRTDDQVIEISVTRLDCYISG